MGSASYHLSEILCSVVGLADTSGVIQSSFTYEAFGKTTVAGVDIWWRRG
jgi:hypothetical protein